MEAVELAGVADQMRPLCFEHLPDRALRLLDMLMGAGVSDASVQQPAVQLVVGFEAQTRREEALAHQPHLVLDLPLLQSDAGAQTAGSIRK